MKRIELKAFSTWLGENEICYTIVKPNSIIELPDAIENRAAVLEVSEGKTYPLLVNLKEIKSISKEARDHFSMKDITQEVSAIGILIKSHVSIIIGNFFIGISKPTVPTQLFKNEEKAIAWLKQFSKQ